MAIALVLAIPLLGGGTSIFQAIQEYTGFVAPGIVAVFGLGFFWKRTNTPGAFALLISSVVLSLLFYLASLGAPDAAGVSVPRSQATSNLMGGIFNPVLGLVNFDVLSMPFVVRIWFIFLICLIVGVVVSLLTKPPYPDQPVDLGGSILRRQADLRLWRRLLSRCWLGSMSIFGRLAEPEDNAQKPQA